MAPSLRARLLLSFLLPAALLLGVAGAAGYVATRTILEEELGRKDKKNKPGNWTGVSEPFQGSRGAKGAWGGLGAEVVLLGGPVFGPLGALLH